MVAIWLLNYTFEWVLYRPNEWEREFQLWLGLNFLRIDIRFSRMWPI